MTRDRGMGGGGSETWSFFFFVAQWALRGPLMEKETAAATKENDAVCFLCLDTIETRFEWVTCFHCKRPRLCIYCVDEAMAQDRLAKIKCVCGQNFSPFFVGYGRMQRRRGMMTNDVRDSLARRCVTKFHWSRHDALRVIWAFLDFYATATAFPSADTWDDLQIIPSPKIDKLWALFQSDRSYSVWQHWMRSHPNPAFREQRFRVWSPSGPLYPSDENITVDFRYMASCRAVAINSGTYPDLLDTWVWPKVDFHVGAYPIKVKSLTGGIRTLLVRPSDSVRTLLLIASAATGTPADQIRYVFAGHQITNDLSRTMADLNITEDSTLTVSLTLRGD